MHGRRNGARPVVAVAGCVAQQEGEKLLSKTNGQRHRRRSSARRASSGCPMLVDEPRSAGRPASRLARHRPQPVRGRLVSAGDGAARRSASRPTSRSSKAATSSAPSASSRTRAATSGCGRSQTSSRTSATPRRPGAREVQLLGQIVNHYQAPDDPPCDFAESARAGERGRRASSGSGSRARIRGTSRRA